MNKKMASAVIAFSFFARGAIAEDKPCAVMEKTEKGVQVIPAEGSVLNQTAVDMPLGCGSMVSTHQGVFWFKYLTQTTFKLSPETFFEVSKNSTQEFGNEFHLYRGQVLLNSPPLEKALVITTPNSRIEFKGGVAFIEYQQAKKMTTAASFNRSFDFKNKFNPDTTQTVRVGEVSHLNLADSRLRPSQPEVMSASTVNQSLVGFQLSSDERTEMKTIVENVFEARAKSFNTDFDQWQTVEVSGPKRSVASESEPEAAIQPSKRSIETIDPKEAEFSMELMRKHLYGDDEDQKILQAGSRKPASVEKIKDTEYDREKHQLKKETEGAVKEISTLPETND
jgi:hypothetical protein